MTLPRQVAVVSYRLGGTDGVAIEARKWMDALHRLGCDVKSVAGQGTADEVLAGLSPDASHGPTRRELDRALDGADLVIVENVCSLPMNPCAYTSVAAALASRRALLHHHDLALERVEFATFGAPPNDECWTHVCISRHAQSLLTQVGLKAFHCYNTFDPYPKRGARGMARAALGLSEEDRLVLQPTRAIARKAIPLGLKLAETLHATYWLTGAVEDGYQETFDQVMHGAKTRVVHKSVESYGLDIADAYAACDLVALPSSWEGFGNPAIEAALHERPLSVGDYPVARELAAFGFIWHEARDTAGVVAFMNAHDDTTASHNASIARQHFSSADLPDRLARLLEHTMATPR